MFSIQNMKNIITSRPRARSAVFRDRSSPISSTARQSEKVLRGLQAILAVERPGRTVQPRRTYHSPTSTSAGRLYLPRMRVRPLSIDADPRTRNAQHMYDFSRELGPKKTYPRVT